MTLELHQTYVWSRFVIGFAYWFADSAIQLQFSPGERMAFASRSQAPGTAVARPKVAFTEVFEEFVEGRGNFASGKSLLGYEALEKSEIQGKSKIGSEGFLVKLGSVR